MCLGCSFASALSPSTRFCPETLPPSFRSVEETSKLSPFFEFCKSQSAVLGTHRATEFIVTQSLSVAAPNRQLLEIRGHSSERSEMLKGHALLGRLFDRGHQLQMSVVLVCSYKDSPRKS